MSKPSTTQPTEAACSFQPPECGRYSVYISPAVMLSPFADGACDSGRDQCTHAARLLVCTHDQVHSSVSQPCYGECARRLPVHPYLTYMCSCTMPVSTKPSRLYTGTKSCMNCLSRQLLGFLMVPSVPVVLLKQPMHLASCSRLCLGKMWSR